ncbi:YceH family protein [Edaphobacter sp. HDX4]|uniref:YceH family protein n=1 Tax=Edaphobacter sp. HDX4 TaxID=2794064 RepID=UPI002FE57955
MMMVLDPVQIRVLGSLIEKEITTPESYPMSLNALVNACNQRSSRDPVLELTEDEVRQALNELEEREIVRMLHDARVPKFEHRFRTVLNLRRDETALLCLLMLRGPQTPGELRGRSERLYTFDDISSVQSTLERLASREASNEEHASKADLSGPLVALLPRQPGARESRYMHLLAGSSDLALPHSENSSPRSEAASQIDRIARLESQLASLMEALAALESRVAELEPKA